MPLAVGETFNRFEIQSLIGRGGMGEVYLALDTHLRRKVALKVLRPDRDNDDAVARLFREARAAAGLSHPNTIAIHDIGEAEGTVYIVMELVTGSSLLTYVGDDRTSPARKLGWLAQVARALSAAHRAGVVHRDVKPSNVMVTEDDVVKVLDFGLAKPLAPVSFKTQQGHVLGTPRYMSPEQLAGSEVDARGDQYSFGVVAYELLCGKHPGGALAGPEPPTPLDDVSTEISAGVAGVIARTLRVSPRERFASMDDVATALDDAIAGRPVRGTVRPSLPADTLRAGAPVDSMAASTETSPRMLAAEEATPSDDPFGGKTAPLGTVSPLAASVPQKRALERTLVSLDAVPRLPPEPPTPPPAPPPPAPVMAPAPPPPSGPRSAPVSAPRPPPRALPTLAIAIVVLGACAFAGSYYGSRALATRIIAPAASSTPIPSTTATIAPPPPDPDPPLPLPPLEPTASGQPRPAKRPHPTPAPPRPMDKGILE